MDYEVVTEHSIRFNGRKYCEKHNGYYYNSSTRRHLHQAIWEYYNGPIPEGYEIHHIDFNTRNNDISNLQCLTRAEHRKLHADALTDEQREWRRNNMMQKVRHAASEWHKSERGREWHREHAKKMIEHGTNAFTKREELTCTMCGKKYMGVRNHTKKNSEGNTFCSNNCKARFLRRKRSQDKSDKRVCCICGKEFMASPWSRAKTCSRSCSMSLRAENMKERRGQ